MNRTEKTDTVAELQKKLAGSKAIILTDFRGLKVEQMTALRQRLRQDKIAYQVVKNTLMKRAIEGSPLEKLKDYFQGPTAVAISYGEPIALAKALTEFQKTLPNLEVKVGLIEGSLTSPPEIKSLVKIGPDPRGKVVLYASDTGDGILCARILAEFIRRRCLFL